MAFDSGKTDYRPPMWSSQLFGEPRGEWLQPDTITDPVTKKMIIWDNENVSNGRLVQIETLIRKLVDMHKEPPEFGWQHLFELLRVGDSGRRRRSGRIALDTFRAILQKTFRRQQFTLTKEEGVALFMKYGHDTNGEMPYEMFARRIFTGQGHQLSLEGCKKKAFDANDDTDWAWQGMIKYPICRSGVFAPSDWEDYSTAVCRRSACKGMKDNKPEAYLKLEHVFGYSSFHNKAPNLFYNKKGDIVYYTAAVGIVYDDDNNRQKFFLRHDDDIRCLAMSPDRDTVATGQVGAEPIVYIWSSTTLRGPKDPTGKSDPVMLQLPYGHRGVVVCGFNRDGSKLATVSTDNDHTVSIWDWKAKVVEATGSACQGIPPMCWGIVWNPFFGDAGAHPADFVTMGVKHIMFWTLGGATGLEAGAASFDVCEQQDILCACFLATNHCLTGGPNGRIYCFEDGMGIKEIQAHAPGRVEEDDPDQVVRGGGVHTLVLCPDKESVLSGGGDGRIVLWKVQTSPNFELIQDREFARDLFDSTGPLRKFTGLDVMPNGDGDYTFVAGDSENDIWEVDEDPRVMVEGQSGDVNSVATYPVQGMEHIYATASEDGNIYLWDADRRENLQTFEVRRQTVQGTAVPKGCKIQEQLMARCVAFNEAGDLLAVTTSGVIDPEDPTFGWNHVDKGGVLQVWECPGEMLMDDQFSDEEFVPKVIFETKDNYEPIDDVKFSPDGKYLATGSHDNWIDIYEVGSWKHMGRCKGHSSWISHIDWSTDSQTIQATDAAYEMLYWKPDGSQRVVCQRDNAWHTWTCTLGFWVMGMWPDGYNGSDINSVCRSKKHGKKEEEFLAAADDKGKVWLFNYPCVIEDAPGHAFKGHASHVQDVRFSADDKRVFSCGGHDRSLFQWKTHGITQPSRHFKKEARLKPGKIGAGPMEPKGSGKNERLALELQVREMELLVSRQKRSLAERESQLKRLTASLGATPE